MRKLTVLICLITTQLSFAGYWMPVDSYVDSSTTEEGVERILTKFPEIRNAGNFTAKDVRNIYVSLVDLMYEGETTCTQGDPRLTYQHFSYSVCLKNVQGACLDHYDDIKDDTDPCL